MHDSEFAEEIFDAAMRGLFNHRRLYKEHQMMSKQSVPTSDNEAKALKFEREVERQEVQRMLFDLKKYKNRPNTIPYASGVPKSSTMYRKNQALSGAPAGGGNTDRQQKQEASVVYVSSNHQHLARNSKQ